MFLKIIREVQTTKGTLLLANWKVACTSQGMTDFDRVVGQHTSYMSLRYGSLPAPAPRPPDCSGLCLQTHAAVRNELSTTQCPTGWQLSSFSATRRCSGDGVFWPWMVTSGHLTFQAGL